MLSCISKKLVLKQQKDKIEQWIMLAYWNNWVIWNNKFYVFILQIVGVIITFCMCCKVKKAEGEGDEEIF